MSRNANQTNRRKRFPQKEAIQRLLWCNRHCCLCDKACGVDIELAHIDNDPSNNSIDNAIPVCYDCHAKLGAYNDRHPRGNKFKIDEITQRREFIYEKYTREYLAPLEYMISNKVHPWAPYSACREFPSLSFCVRNLSDFLPTKLSVLITGEVSGKSLKLNLTDPLYRGEKKWNLNPRSQINGWFKINNQRAENPQPSDIFRIRIKVTQEDVLGREHKLLEDGFVARPPGVGKVSTWAFEP